MANLPRWARRDRVDDGPPDDAVDLPAEPSADPPLVDLDKPYQPDEPVEPDQPDQPVEPDQPDQPVEPVDADEPDDRRSAAARLRLSILDSTPVLLFQAAHPRQALVTGLGLGIVALAADRAPREAAVVAVTALVGQVVLGWHNDIVDRAFDARHDTPRKPVADGRLEVGTAWYAAAIAVLVVIPLSIATGVDAGLFFLGSLVAGLLGNVVLRRGPLSWVTWATQYALFAPYVALGGWGGDARADPPQVVMVVLFALLGVGVHVLRAIWGLVADDDEGWTYLPLVLGRRVGATRLLVLASTYTAVVLAVMVIVGGTVGLRA